MDDQPLTLLRPCLPSAEDLRSYLERIDEAGIYSNFGELSQELEAKLAHRLTRGEIPAYVTALSSGTAGLELSLMALRLKPGAKILLPSLTFPATATAIIRAGYQPVFADVDPVSWVLTPELCQEISGVSAVMPVAVFGLGSDAQAWDQFTENTEIPVIIDAAAAFGNQLPGQTTHAVFSMHATKPLAAGEGGFVVTCDPEFADRVRRLSNFGFTDGTIQQAGTNAKLSEYHAAVALASLRTWDFQAEQRLRLAERFAEALHDPAGRITFQAPGRHWVQCVNIVRLKDADLLAVMSKLTACGIESRRWYWPPLHQHPAFQSCRPFGSLSITEQLANELLGLPFHLQLPPNSPERLAEGLRRALT